MSSGLYSGVSGLALGVGLYKGVSGLWGGSSGLIDGFGGPTPALSLNFLSGALDSRITFTRSTTATFVGSNGLIQTAAINAPRFDFNPITLAPLGLLIEEQRTNLLLQSEDFSTTWLPVGATVTTNTTVAPDGTTTGDTIAAATTASYVRQAVTFTGNGSKSYSVFVKAGTATVSRLVLRDTTPTAANRGGVNLTWTAGVPSGVATDGGTLEGIDAYPNGWYRVRAVATGVVAANANEFRFSPDTAVGTGTTIFWGAQTENGAFATSYIPTVASQVTRTADIAVMTGTNFSSWYNASEGTFVASFEASPNTFTTYVAASNGVVAQNSMHMDNDGAGNMRSAYYSGSSAVALLGLGAVGTIGAVNRMATAYKVNDFAASRNGGAVVTDTLGAVPVGVTQLNIGADPSGAATNVSNTHIRSITYYNTRFPNAQLPGLSA